MCAESLQSYPTLCDSVDCRPPGSSVHGILQAKNTGVGCHALLQGTFPPQDLTCASMSPALAGKFFTASATHVLNTAAWK